MAMQKNSMWKIILNKIKYLNCSIYLFYLILQVIDFYS